MQSNNLDAELWDLRFDVMVKRELPQMFSIGQHVWNIFLSKKSLWKWHQSDGNKEHTEFFICVFQVPQMSIHLPRTELKKKEYFWKLEGWGFCSKWTKNEQLNQVCA